MVSGIEPAGAHPIPWKSQLRILWVIRQATGSFRSASVRMELTRIVPLPAVMVNRGVLPSSLWWSEHRFGSGSFPGSRRWSICCRTVPADPFDTFRFPWKFLPEIRNAGNAPPCPANRARGICALFTHKVQGIFRFANRFYKDGCRLSAVLK